DKPERRQKSADAPRRVRGRRRRSTSWAYWLPVTAPAIPAEVDPATVPCRAPGCTDGAWHRVQRLCWRCYRSACLSLGHAPGKERTRTLGDEDRPMTYAAVHYRLRGVFGPPGAGLCARCGVRAAEEWAMRPDAATVRLSTDGKRVADLDEYIPMCCPCHRPMDSARPPAGAEMLSGIDWSGVSTHVDAQGRPLRDWIPR
ncbi:hypothetical protein ACT3TE_12500, partial [Brachybacterium sp. AOP42-B2-9]